MLKIKVCTKDLEGAIKKLDLVRMNKSKLEILENLKIAAINDKLILSSADLENTMLIEIEATVEIEGEAILTNIGKFKQSLKFFRHDFISIEANNSDNMILKSGNKEIIIRSLNVEEFPMTPTVEDAVNYTYNVQLFYNRIIKLLPATAKDELRPILTGVHFNKYDMVALDGCRAHINSDQDLYINSPFTVSQNILKVFTKTINKRNSFDMTMSVNKQYIKLQYSNVTLISRLLEGDFFNYNQVLPKEYKTCITVDKTQLLENIEFLSTHVEKIVRLNIKDQLLQIDAENIEGKYKASLKLIKLDGESNFQITLNHAYLRDALKCVDDKNIRIEMTESLRPIIIRNDFETYLILPVRI